MSTTLENCGRLSCWMAGIILGAATTANAGAVSINFDSGLLTITGSALDDRVTVFGNAEFAVVRAGFGTTFTGGTRFLDRKTRIFNNVSDIVYVAGGGNDQLSVLASVNSLTYTGGAGNEFLTVSATELGSIQAELSDGDDLVVLQTGVSDMVDINLGNGMNTLNIRNSMLANLSVIGGTGPDQLIFTGLQSVPVTGMALSVMSGSGDDLVGFQMCEVTAPDPMMPAILDGGDDMDSVGEDMSVFTPVPVPVNFETVIGFTPPPPPPSTKASLGQRRR